MELVVVLEAVHNRDGSIGRWTFLLDVEQFEFHRRSFTNGNNFLVPMQMDKPSRDGSISKDYGSRELHAVAHRTAPDLLANIEEFVATGVWTAGDGPADGRIFLPVDDLLMTKVCISVSTRWFYVDLIVQRYTNVHVHREIDLLLVALLGGGVSYAVVERE